MKKTVFPLLLLLVMLFSGNLKAQDFDDFDDEYEETDNRKYDNGEENPISFRFNGGANMSNFRYENTGSDFILGWQASVLLDIPLSSRFSLQGSVGFITKGGELKFPDEAKKITSTLSYAKIPAYIAYKFPIGEEMKLSIFTGPYAEFGLSGTEKTTYSGSSTIQDSSQPFFRSDQTRSRKGFGMDAGASLEYKHFVVTAGYDTNLRDYDVSEVHKNKNQSIFLSLGYSFY